MVLWLTPHHTLVVRAFAAATAHSHAVDYIAVRGRIEGEHTGKAWHIIRANNGCSKGNSPLLRLVAQAVSFVSAGGLVHTVDFWQLAVLPSAHAHQETEHITLLLAPKLLEVFVSTHLRTLKLTLN